METNIKQTQASATRRDIHQQVTDTIIQQLEAGTVPWQKPWTGEDKRLLSIPRNFTTGKKYRGINILLLWSSAVAHDYPTQEWGSFKQWQERKEAVRKGEKGSMIVYYDTIEKEVDGEIQKIPFLKSSVVFNRCQLANYQPVLKEDKENSLPLFEKIENVDVFVNTTGAKIEHKDSVACYIPWLDKICMPPQAAFIDTVNCTAKEGYYSTLLHELTHWTGSKDRLNRLEAKKFGDRHYATEELVAELGAAFLCAEFEISPVTKDNHAGYIEHWLKVLKENKHCLFTAASESSKACDFLHSLQVKMPSPTPK